MNFVELFSTLQNLTNKKITQADIGRALNVDRSAIFSRVKHYSEVKLSEIEKIADFYNISVDDILNKTSSCLENINNEEFLVDYYPDVFGSCGTGVFEISEVKEKMSVPLKIVECYDKTKQYSVINAYGDSMQPFIQDGDMLVVEHQENDFIIDSRIYVFRYGEEIFIKRLVKNINQVVIKSDNKDYSPITLFGEDLKNFQIIGRIVGMMRKL